jgi:hypothetical protein
MAASLQFRPFSLQSQSGDLFLQKGMLDECPFLSAVFFSVLSDYCFLSPAFCLSRLFG